MYLQNGLVIMNKSVKIAIVSPSAPPLAVGGITSAHYNLFNSLKDHGCTVKLFTFQDHRSVCLVDNDIIRGGTPNCIARLAALASSFLFRLLSGPRMACEIMNIVQSALGVLQINIPLRRFRPDVLIIPDQCAPGFFIFKPPYCRIVLISHHNAARFLQDPFCRSEHDVLMALHIENRVLKKAEQVICPSRYMKEQFLKTYKFGGPVSVLPNVVNDRFISTVSVCNLRKELSLPDESPVIYIPSAGSRLKGSQFVFEIIRRLSSGNGGLIGFYLSGDIDAELRHELKYVPGNVKIHAPGQVNYHQNIALIKACSFGVSPTLIESFGMAIIEAMFCGVPMVTFDVGGIPDIISNGENGFTAPYMDMESLINCARKLLDNRIRSTMRENALQAVRERFDSDSLTDQFLELVVKRQPNPE